MNADYETLGRPSVTLDDIRRFRQLDSKAPGHPEYHWTSGVETTTGPLGQGVSTSVGMAIAEKWLASHFNRPDFEVFDYNVYVVCSDGCLMEGVGSEAASLAGHLGLDNLCWVYDNNHITIEREHAHHFHGRRRGALPGLWLERAAGRRRQRPREHRTRPQRLPEDERSPHIHCFGHPHRVRAPHKQDTAEAHGEPLGDEEVRLAKRFYGGPRTQNFWFLTAVRAFRRRNRRARRAVTARMDGAV